VKIVHSWLQDLVPVGSSDTDVVAVADTLTHLGLAVEDVKRVGSAVPGVITARVLRTERHPDAAKVHRVFVDAGDGVERHVWCGAFNMAAGDVVPLATPGTDMPDGRRIEPRPILGIDSAGMLCSARELGLGDDHSGILLLAPDTPLGLPYGEALGLVEEVVYDLDVLRNRPDCWGHLGVARDLSAAMDVALTGGPDGIEPTGDLRTAPVVLVDGTRCARFTTVVISGVHVGASPDWMARRLVAAGMRPINNVVDVSNYVMLETNQPNHAYDAGTVTGGFRVRRAASGERLVTLDDVERTLDSDDLLICDGDDRPIGLAGVMGGCDTEISDATTSLVLEIAWFEPTGIMRTAQRHGLRSEASARFERGVDPYGTDRAVARFVELLRLSSPSLVVHHGAVDERSEAIPPSTTEIAVRVNRVNAVLGTDLPASRMVSLLEAIGYGCSVDDNVVIVAVPSWRPDSVGEIEVIEEIARCHGYGRIARTVPKSVVHGSLSAPQRRRRQVRDVLHGLGISEAMPNPFLAEGAHERAGLSGDVVRIVNALVADEPVLRRSLRPGLLSAIAYNESYRSSDVALYEIGHVYPPGAGELPDEYEALAVVCAGRDATAAVEVWRTLSRALGWGARLDQSQVPDGMHPARSAVLSVGRDIIGAVGEVHPDVLDAFGVSERVAILELQLGRLLALEPKAALWRPVSKYPSSDLDLAFLVPDDVPAERVEKAIRQAAAALLGDLRLFDVYRGAGVDAGRRSLAYRVRLQAPDRTLTDDDVAGVRTRAEAAVAKLGGVLRG
jgi:phenylalanyl-tRNA synthetase beta chain